MGAPNEIGSETRSERPRDPCQIAERSQPVAPGSFLPHGYGVGILEPKRWQPASAETHAKLASDLTVNLLRIRVGTLAENSQKPGAGVFGVDIDLIGTKSLERNLSSTEACSAAHVESTSLEKLGKHLGQQIRLTERLRGD